MQIFTGTRLTTAIHRRLLSRFLLREGGTSVHRLNRITSLKVFHVLLYRLYDRIRRFVSELIAIIDKELKHDENGMSFKASTKNKPHAHQVSSQDSFAYK